MKLKSCLLLVAALGLMTVSSKADYSLQVATTTSGTSPNAVFDVDGVTKVDNTFLAQIKVNGTFLANVFNFGQNGAAVVPALNGYLSAGTINPSSTVLYGGSSATVQLFAFKGAATYDQAAVTIGAKIGNSASPITVTLGGLNQAGDNNFTVPNLASMQGFTMSTVVVPEPATIALGLFGAAGLLMRRRK
jgi:PEP-CTERM motif